MLKTDPELQRLIPPLTAAERAGLESSIRSEGCRNPLVVWTDTGILLDGHHRFEICTRLGQPYNTAGLTLPDRSAALEWVIRNQFGRRNLTNYQKAELALKLQDVLRPAAEARMLAGRADPLPNSGEGRVDDEIAAAAGVGHDTIHRVRYIAERGDDATKERLRQGEATINAEYTRMKTPGRILSSASVEWYTPAKYVDAARRVLDGIDVDPASCTQANETVRAARYYTQEDDGLQQDWAGHVWLNPPFGGLAGPFGQRLLQQYEAGITTAAIILFISAVASSVWFRPFWDRVLCFTDHRMAFYGPSGGLGERNIVAQLFAYLGPDEDRFIEVFEEFGPVVRRVRSRAVL